MADFNTFVNFITSLTKNDKSHDTPHFVLQALPEVDKRKIVPRPEFFSIENIDKAYAYANEYNTKGYCVSICVHEMGSKGTFVSRQKKDCTRARGFLIDIDHYLSKDSINKIINKLLPTSITLSSYSEAGFKSHLYFLFDKNLDFPLSQWDDLFFTFKEAVDAFLCRELGIKTSYCDPQAGALNTVIRCPGFLHLKDPTNPKTIVWKEISDFYNKTTLTNLFDLLCIYEIKEEKVEKKKNTKRHIDKTTDYVITAEGNRNETLYNYVLKNLRWEKNLTELEALGASELINNVYHTPPLSTEEVQNIVKSAYSQAYTKDNINKIKTDQVSQDIGLEQIVTYDTFSTAFFAPLSEIALSERLLQSLSGEIAAHPGVGILVYNKEQGIWEPNVQKLMACYLEIVKKMSKEVQIRLLFTKNNRFNEESFMKYITKISTINYFERLVRTILVSSACDRALVSKLDSKDTLLNCKNGVVNLNNGQLLEHNPGYFFTKTANAYYDYSPEIIDKLGNLNRQSDYYDSTLPCSRFVQFIYEISDGDISWCHYIQKFLGYCLLAGNKEQLFHFFWGGGANGKSKLLDIVVAILGTYADNIDSKLLIKKGNTDTTQSSKLAQLQGVRFVVGSETPADMAWDDKLIKNLTGDKEIVARKLYHEAFNYEFKANIIVPGNHSPTITGDSYGIWRRFRKLGFTRTFKENERDINLEEKILGTNNYKEPYTKQATGILQWLVAGCLRYQIEGLAPIENIIDNTNDYRHNLSPITSFIDECLETVPYEEVTSKCLTISDIKDYYNIWRREYGYEAITSVSEMARILGDLGFKTTKLKDNKNARHTNLKITTTWASELDKKRNSNIISFG